MHRPLRYVHADARSIRDAMRSVPITEIGATKLYRVVLPQVPASWVKGLSPGLVVLARR